MPYPEPNDDRVVALLEAILTEQRAMGARQADAIEHQRRVLDVQQKATVRASRILTSLIVALCVVIVAAYFWPYVAFWAAHR